MKKIFFLGLVIIVVTGCAKVDKKIITIDTDPHGAKIIVIERDNQLGKNVTHDIGLSPIKYEIKVPEFSRYASSSSIPDDPDDDFSVHVDGKMVKKPKYTIKAEKEGYFAEEKSIVNYDTVFKDGEFQLYLEKSPMWWATTKSPAGNQWMNLIINPDLSPAEMWQRIVDAVTKRFPDLKEYDFTSGYLVTTWKKKSFKTSRGTFLLRSRFIATVMEKNPLTYRMKLISEWSDKEELQWRSYPRVFLEDAQLINELMERFQAY